VGGIFYYIHQYHLDGTTMMASMIIGFSLAGVSSSFVIPILSQIRVGGKLFSRLALESALTDVFCIVATLSVIEVYTTGIFGVQKTLTYLIELFAIAGFIGVLGGIIWIVIRVFEEQNYIITIAYLLLVYLATEYFGGNGPIAALFLGLILNNSKQLSSIKEGILSRSVAEKQKAIQGDLGVEVTSATEKRYYHLISFFLKALFFIYVGILLDITDQTALVIGSILSVLIMITRMGSMPLTKGMPNDQRQLVNAVFARGLAAAVLIQAVIQAGMPGAEYMGRVVYVVIIGTIILSSLRVFILRMNLAKPKG
jgi:NhaP-type Na+/H+ or K+/H+ antiporter